ncbi:hypothetical protein FS842_008422 [Serendipita sp. 407]|nr:hypothetical protein FS842_008422 [Serendipita sp. 407]
MKHLLSMDSLRRKQPPMAAHPNGSQQSLASVPMVAVRQSPPVSYQHLNHSNTVNHSLEGGLPFQIPHGEHPQAGLPISPRKGLPPNMNPSYMYNPQVNNNSRSRPLPVPNSMQSQLPPPVAYNPPIIVNYPSSKNRRPLPQPSVTSHASSFSFSSSSHKHSHSESSTVTSISLATTQHGQNHDTFLPKSHPPAALAAASLVDQKYDSRSVFYGDISSNQQQRPSFDRYPPASQSGSAPPSAMGFHPSALAAMPLLALSKKTGGILPESHVHVHPSSHHLYLDPPPTLPPLNFGSKVSLFDTGTPTFSFSTPSTTSGHIDDQIDGGRVEASTRRPPLPRVPSTAPAVRSSFYETHAKHDTKLSQQTQGPSTMSISRQTTLTNPLPFLQPPSQNFDPRHASILNTPDPTKTQEVPSTMIRFGSSFVPATPQAANTTQPRPAETRPMETKGNHKASADSVPVSTPVLSTEPSSATTAVEPTLKPTLSRDGPSCPSTPTLSAGSSAGTTANLPPLPVKSAARSETLTRKRKERPALTIRTWDLEKKKKNQAIEIVEHVPVQSYQTDAVMEQPTVAGEGTKVQKESVSQQNATKLPIHPDPKPVPVQHTSSKRPQPPKSEKDASNYDSASFLPTWSGGAMNSESARTGAGSRTEMRPRPSEEERSRVVHRKPAPALPASMPPPSAKTADKGDKLGSAVGEQLKKIRIGRRKSKSVSGWPGFEARPSGSSTNFSGANGSTTSLTAPNAVLNNGGNTSVPNSARIPNSASRPSFSFASFGRRPANPYYDHTDTKEPSSARSSFSNLSFSLFRPRSRSRSQSLLQQEQQQAQITHQHSRKANQVSNVDYGIVRADIFRGAASTGEGRMEPGGGATAKVPVDPNAGLPWQASGSSFPPQNFRRAPPPMVSGDMSDGTQGTKPVSALWTKLRSKKTNRI